MNPMVNKNTNKSRRNTRRTRISPWCKYNNTNFQPKFYTINDSSSISKKKYKSESN